MLRRFITDVFRLVFARPIFQSFNRFLFGLSLRGMGVLNFEDENWSGEAHFRDRILGLLLSKSKGEEWTFVDVGANLGDYSRGLLDDYPCSRVIAVEPHPINQTKLRAAGGGDRLTIVEAAAGAETGSLTLYDRSDEEGSEHVSAYRGVLEDIHLVDAKPFEAPVRRLDDICEEHVPVGQIDLIKIDTEGHELAVLRGGEHLIKSLRVAVFQIEFNEMNIFSKTFVRDLEVALPGYRVYRMLPRGLCEMSRSLHCREIFAFQNLVFVREDLAGKD